MPTAYCLLTTVPLTFLQIKHFKNVLQLLDRYGQDDILPESEGMTAGRLAEIINSMNKEVLV